MCTCQVWFWKKSEYGLRKKTSRLKSAEIQKEFLDGFGYFSNECGFSVDPVFKSFHWIRFSWNEPFVSSNFNMIWTLQTCGQGSSRVAGSKHRVLAFCCFGNLPVLQTFGGVTCFWPYSGDSEFQHSNYWTTTQQRDSPPNIPVCRRAAHKHVTLPVCRFYTSSFTNAQP